MVIMNNIKNMHKGFIMINGNRFAVRLALSEVEQADGLMHVDPPLVSMAFVYPTPQINKFWMRNVKDDLEILFCYKGKIIDIVKGSAQSTKLLGKEQYSDLVIEFPMQISSKYDFNVGDDIKISLSKEAVDKILAG